MELNSNTIYKNCHYRNKNRKDNKPFLISKENLTNSSKVPIYLPILIEAEEILIIYIYIFI
jgi:hypothetical protein